MTTIESLMAGGRRISALRPPTAALVVGLALAAALAVGLVTGVQAYLVATQAGLQVELAPQVQVRTLAAVAWVLVGIAVVRVARRWPVSRSGWQRAALVHFAGALLAGLAVNVIIHAVARALGLRFPGGFGFWTETGLDTLENVHLNVLVYAAMILGVRWTDAYRARVAAAAEMTSSAAPSDVSLNGSSPPSTTALQTSAPVAPYAVRLSVRRHGALVVVPVDDVDWVEAADDYACLHVGSRRHLSDDRLHVLEKTLDPTRFVRVHRSALVNLGQVREVVEQRWGDGVAVLRDGTRVRVSRTRREALLEALRGR
jgi:LytTr DNA-binding domain-containing protein